MQMKRCISSKRIWRTLTGVNDRNLINNILFTKQERTISSVCEKCPQEYNTNKPMSLWVSRGNNRAHFHIKISGGSLAGLPIEL